MQILKKIALTFVALIALVLIVALFTKKDYTVARDIVIEQPRMQVYNYLKMLRNQDNFSVWALKDPAMAKTYRGTDGTVGFVSAWESKDPEVGKGEQEIIAFDEGKAIKYELRFIEPWSGVADASIETEDASNTSTRVRWTVSSTMKYPTNAMMWVMDMDKMLGESLNSGLVNLKNILEKPSEQEISEIMSQ